MTGELGLFPVDEVPPGRTQAHRVLTATQQSVPLPAAVRRGGQPVTLSLARGVNNLMAGWDVPEGSGLCCRANGAPG
jgi:hypothetical protein